MIITRKSRCRLFCHPQHNILFPGAQVDNKTVDDNNDYYISGLYTQLVTQPWVGIKIFSNISSKRHLVNNSIWCLESHHMENHGFKNIIIEFKKNILIFFSL